MKHLLMSAALVALAGAAHAECGDVTIGMFSWQSSEAMASVDKLILSAGYGATHRPSQATPSRRSPP